MFRSGSIRLFRFAGIGVFLHWSWILVAFIRVPTMFGGEMTLGWAAMTYVALFAIVLMHEFGHSLACRRVGGGTHDIILWPLGGIAYVSPPPRPGATLWSIAAGPLVNLMLIPVLFALGYASARLGWNDLLPGIAGFWRAIQGINLGLFIFNVFPVYPLDGGQILRSLLWYGIGRIRSLQVAAIIGLVGVVAFGGLALVIGDMWLLFIALFLGQRCWIGLREAKYLQALERAARHPGFACPVCHQSPPGGPMWGCRNCGGRFDPFSTNAVCPHCGTAQGATMCPFCGTASAIEGWRGQEPPLRPATP